MRNRLCLIIITTLFIVACDEAKPPNFTGSMLYVFGDSLSDVGNANIASAGLLPDKNYFKGNFSNGLNYTQYLAITQETAIKPSRSYGSNYAFAGAKSIAVDAQVSNYKENVDNQADSSALFIIWSGSNDLLDILQSVDSDIDSDMIISNSILHIESAIRKLDSMGATHLLVLNQVNLARLPRFISLESTGSTRLADAEKLSTQFNVQLAAMLDRLVNDEGIPTMRFDVFTLFEEIARNQGAYDLVNISEPCYIKNEFSFVLSGAETICSNAGSFLFWDSIHPSTTGHRILAERMRLLIEK